MHNLKHCARRCRRRLQRHCPPFASIIALVVVVIVVGFCPKSVTSGRISCLLSRPCKVHNARKATAFLRCFFLFCPFFAFCLPAHLLLYAWCVYIANEGDVAAAAADQHAMRKASSFHCLSVYLTYCTCFAADVSTAAATSAAATFTACSLSESA